MRVQISFLGTSDYQPCTYQWKEQRSKETAYFQKAVYDFFQPDRCLIILTEEAARMHARELQKEIPFETVHIPAGRDETELWEIFKALTQHVNEHDTLIVDVTHGLRTQPMLALAALYYLRVTRNVEIERIVYGAFDAQTDTGVVPVFDLTPFLQLIEWSMAAYLFVRYGQANELATLLRKIHRLTYIDPSSDVRAKHAAGAATLLERFSRGLGLARLQEVLKDSAGRLSGALQRVRQDIEHIPRLQPFMLLLDQTASRVQPLHHPDPYSYEGLKAQAALIQLLLDYGFIQQAITVAREAVVTRAALDSEYDPIKERREAEQYLNELAHGLQDPSKRQAYTEAQRKLAEFWNQLTDVRNDINHAGMRERPTPASTLLTQVTEVAHNAIDWITRHVDQSE